MTIDLPSDLYERFNVEAEHAGKLPAIVAGEWLAERLSPPAALSERELAREALRAAGLLVESSSEEIVQARARLQSHNQSRIAAIVTIAW